MIGVAGISGLFKAAGGIVDNLHTSDEERLKLKNSFAELQGSVMSDVLEYQKSLNEAQPTSSWPKLAARVGYKGHGDLLRC